MAVIDSFVKLQGFTIWTLPNNCNLYSNERMKLMAQLKSLSIPSECRFHNMHLGQWVTLDRYNKDYEGCRRLMSETSRVKQDDFYAKTRVLEHY